VLVEESTWQRGKDTIVRILLLVQIILLVQLTTASAQEGTGEKRLPETRRLDLPVSAPDTMRSVPKSPMPKIDLPEYVITGKAVIDLPGVEKQSVPGDSPSGLLASLLNPSLTRSRQTAQFALGGKEEMEGKSVSLYNGKVSASLGTFFSPQAGLWFGQTLGEYRYSVDGQYYRTKGFAPHTDRSGGSANLEGSTTLKSYNPYFDQSNVRSALTYKSDTYHWYGTSIPSLSRNRTDFALSAGITNWVNSPIAYKADLGYENFTVNDSSKTVTENRLNLGGATRLMASSVPLYVKLNAQFGSVSYENSSSGLSYIDLMVGSERYTWKAFSLQGSIHGYLASGMEDQRFARLYPHLDVAYQFNDQQTLSVSYVPEIEPGSLSSGVYANRYLSATSIVKHTDDQQDATLAIESEWSARMRTRFAAHVQSINDYPLYADSLSRGIWSLAYGGRTTIASFSGEIFAKLPANDYFAAKLTATMSSNSETGSAVPYLPVFEIGTSYTREIVSHVTGVATLTLIHQRKDNVVNVNTLPSILLIGLRCEYLLIQQATVFLDVQNLLNQQYEYWRGYQENPFVLSAGIALRW
jgi:hypothetical protein